MTYRSAIVALGSCLLLAPLQSAVADSRLPISLKQQVDEVAHRLEGVMDTALQTKSNPAAPNVTLTTCRVSLISDHDTQPHDAILLYQEQALSQNLAKPYRQRFLELAPSVYSGSVESRSFKPANPAAWINGCNRPVADRTVTIRDRGNHVCSVFLRPSGRDFVGNTPADGCAANVRGAVRIKNHIVLHPMGMDTWDQGFDATGKQVWGARGDAYQFRRRE